MSESLNEAKNLLNGMTYMLRSEVNLGEESFKNCLLSQISVIDEYLDLIEDEFIDEYSAEEDDCYVCNHAD